MWASPLCVGETSMGLSRYALAVACVLVVTCGNALPGLTSKGNPALRPATLATLPFAPLLLTEVSPTVISTFSETTNPTEDPRFLEIPEGYVYWKTVTARVTAYDPSYRCCGRFADGKTATMKNAWVLDGVAVDPRAIPYGTKAWIPGIGLREADDTGVAMKRSWSREGVYHIDVRLKYFYQARNWGVKILEVPLFRRIE